ncbi:MAG: HAD family hydrolase [Bacteroidota bacterium]
MIKLVVFDMAGTAINEDNLVYKTIQRTLAEHQVDVDLATVLRLGAGKEKWGAINDILAEVSGNNPDANFTDTIHSSFVNNLDRAYAAFDIAVFPSVGSAIVQLQEMGIKVAFNTGYARPIAENILRQTGLEIGQDLDALATANDVINNRPAPDMILLLCKQLGCQPKEVIKIGDSGVDIKEGQNAGAYYSIGITTGAQTREQLAAAQPDFIIDDMLELIPILQAVNKPPLNAD